MQLTKSLSSCYLCAKLIFINIIFHQFLFLLLLLSVSLNIFLVQVFSVMFNDFLMKARHFIKTSCKQKVKTFFRSTLINIKRQMGTTLDITLMKWCYNQVVSFRICAFEWYVTHHFFSLKKLHLPWFLRETFGNFSDKRGLDLRTN